MHQAEKLPLLLLVAEEVVEDIIERENVTDVHPNKARLRKSGGLGYAHRFSFQEASLASFSMAACRLGSTTL